MCWASTRASVFYLTRQDFLGRVRIDEITGIRPILKDFGL